MEDLNQLEENLEDANSTSEMSSFADWGSIISQVQDNLPAIDSDSELSTLTEDSDSELNIFQRNVITFNADERSSEKAQNKSSFEKWQEPKDKQDTVTVNSEGYGSASSSSPNSFTSSAASKSTLSSSSEEKVMQSDKTSSTSLLFQRLNQHLEESVHTSSGGTEDLNLSDLDLELPIYEDDGMLMYGADTEEDKLDRSPPPLDMRIAADQSAGESVDVEPSSDTEQYSSDTSSSVMKAVGKGGKAPVLSLKSLEGFDLDELLDGLHENAGKLDHASTSHEETRQAKKSHTSLMNQLINLSKTQQVAQKNDIETESGQSSSGGGDCDSNEHFLASRQFKEEPGGQSFEEIEEKADTEPVKEAMIDFSTETEKTTSSSCGVTADFPNSIPGTAELSLSEPTTIFLDLRPSAVNITEIKPDPVEETTKNDGKTENIKRFSRRNHGASAKKDEVRKRIRGLNKIKSWAKNEPVESSSDSDKNDDDYDEWKAMRSRIKARSDLSAAASPSNRSSNDNERRELSSSVIDKEENKTLSEEPDSLFSSAASMSRLPHDVKRSIPSFGENIPGIQHIDEAVVKPSMVNDLTSTTERVADGDEIVSGSGDMPELAEDGDVGVYGSQRLKNDTGFAEDASANTSLSKPSVLKSSMRSKKEKTSAKEDKGKITVSFAEEPKRDESDTTSVYREKSLRNISPSNVMSSSSSSVQTEESFSNNTGDLKLNDIVNRILDPKYAEENHHRQSENHVSISTVTDEILTMQSARVEQQFKRASAITTTSLACFDRNATRERKMKQRTVLESILKTKGGNLLPGTQLLFDDDASFNFSLPNLPPELNTERTQMVLLTINLSSPGCVVAHRSTGGHKGGSVDSSIGFSVTYSMLLSWLLAIVPEDLQKLHNARMDDTFTIDMDSEYISDVGDGKDSPCLPVTIDIPFNVVALHQSFREDTQSLSLQAVVIPNFYYKPEAKRGRKKAKKEDAFLQVVWHFLQSNRIQDVCPWHERPESPMHYSLTETIITCATKPLSCYVAAANDPVQIKKALRNNPGFFWKVVTPEDQTPANPAATKINKLETTTLLLNREAFLYPVAVMDIVIRIQTSCSDLSGMRLAYVTKRFLYSNTLYHTSTHYDPEEIVPCVVMAIRGRSAIQKWSKIIGPRDPVLARLTERMSLNATYGEQLSKKGTDGSLPLDLNMFCHPRSESRAQQQLCVWFGGRADIKIEPIPSELQKPADAAKAEKNPGGKNGGKSGKNKSRNGSTSVIDCIVEDPQVPDSVKNILGMPSYLITSCTTRLYLIVSPRLSPQFIGDVLYTAMQQGFLIEGIKRARLNERKAAALSISTRYYSCFCPRVDSDILVDFEYYDDIWWIRPATVILLARENAHAHQAGLWHSLQTDVMCNLSVPEEEGQMKMVTYQCFHTTPHTETVEHIVGSLTKVPDIELSTGSSPRNFYSNPEMEQVVVLSFLGERAIDESGLVLQKLLHGEFSLIPSNGRVITAADLEDESDDDDFRGFELLGLKWLPFLTSIQAKELTPFEVGTSAWHQSIPLLEASPVILCVLRRVNAFEILKRILDIPRYSNTTVDIVLNEKNFYHVMSTTPEIAYRQMRIFFSDKELFSDNQSRPLLKYLAPPTRVYQYRHQQKSLAGDGENGATGDQSYGSRPQDSAKKISSKKKKKQNPKHKDSNSNGNHSNGSSNGSTSFLPEESVFSSMVSCQQPLVSVLVIKPDAFPRHFIKIFKHLHQEGFVVVAAKLLIMSEDEALQLVPPHLRDLHGETQVFLDHMTSGQSLMVCVQRSNAVRHLRHLAGPHDPVVARRRCYVMQRDDSYPLYYSSPPSMTTWRALFGIDNISNGIHVSDSYISACQEMKRFFPEGLCCEETLELKMEMVPTPAEDTLMSLDKMKGREVKIELDERIANGRLLMTYMPRKPIVVVMTPRLMRSPIPKSRPSRHPLTRRHIAPERGTVPPYVEILDKLLEQGFEVCALRMVWFKQFQAATLLEILHKSSVQQQCDDMLGRLLEGPSLLLVLQRENALVLFDSILGSTKTTGETLYHRHSSHILRSQNDSQTKEAARFLFPRIYYQESVLNIHHKKALEWKDLDPGISPTQTES